MTILGHLMKLTNQLTTQPLFIIKISLVHHFFKSESIWNIHDKFLPNPLEMTFQRIYPVIGIALTHYFSNQGPLETCMPNSTQIGPEMVI